MRNKLKFLIGVSLKKKIKSKWFIIANIVIALLIVGIINIDSIIKTFGGDFDSTTTIYVIDETNEMGESFKTNLKTYDNNLFSKEDPSYKVDISDKSYQELVDLIKNEENNSILVQIYYDDNKDLKSKLISYSSLDSLDYQLISSALNTTASMYVLNSIGLTEEQLHKITTGVEIKREILSEDVSTEEENMEMIMTTVFPAFILPFFMLTILLIQFIGTEINDEKSTRSMEIIISNVSPKTHFASKIISNNLFIFIQVVLMFFYGIAGFKIRGIVGGNSITNGVGAEVSKILSNIRLEVLGTRMIPIIIFSIILIILTFIAYSIITGILASMTTNAEDFQHVQSPLVIILIVGYYLSVMAGVFKGSIFIKILSFFPLISAILSPSLLVLGQVSVLEVMLSVLIMIATIVILLKYGMKIYKIGILNYSSDGMWKKLFKSLKD